MKRRTLTEEKLPVCLIRHSDPSLTANVSTDPKLLDVAGAVASLPDLPLGVVGVFGARRRANV